MLILEEKMKKSIFILFICTLLVISCNTMAEKKQKQGNSVTGDGKVIYTVDGAGYTFMELKSDKGTFWAATRQTKVAVGDIVKLINPMLMKNFESKSLQRKFDEIYFADGIVVNGKKDAKKTVSPHGNMGMSGGNGHMADNVDLDVSKVQKAKDGVTVSEILSSPEKYKDKEVVLNVMITKFLPEIMGHNWLHLKDASSNTHLAAITDEKFKKGDVALIKGKVVLDKDFGHGYKYKVLLDKVVAVKK
jgi:hypothetical protein